MMNLIKHYLLIHQHLFADNFFSYISLASDMLHADIFFCGTFRHMFCFVTTNSSGVDVMKPATRFRQDILKTVSKSVVVCNSKMGELTLWTSLGAAMMQVTQERSGGLSPSKPYAWGRNRRSSSDIWSQLTLSPSSIDNAQFLPYFIEHVYILSRRIFRDCELYTK